MSCNLRLVFVGSSGLDRERERALEGKRDYIPESSQSLSFIFICIYLNKDTEKVTSPILSILWLGIDVS